MDYFLNLYKYCKNNNNKSMTIKHIPKSLSYLYHFRYNITILYLNNISDTIDFSIFDFNILSFIKNLDTLSLSNNNITTMPIVHSKSLKKYILSNNNIKNYFSASISNCTSLFYLDISYNNISIIVDNKRFKYFNASFNNLNSIYICSEYIYISNNFIENIDKILLSSFYKNYIKYIDISFNLLSCKIISNNKTTIKQ